MICPIVTSPIILQIPSTEATREDMPTGQNLKETLQAHAHECVGMAANMIGVHKRIIVVHDENNSEKTSKGERKNTNNDSKVSKTKSDPILMYNPEITKSSKPYETKEGCLSLSGVRSTTRFNHIEVRYFDEQFREQTKTFNGFTAQIIQHEIDHCNGILI